MIPIDKEKFPFWFDKPNEMPDMTVPGTVDDLNADTTHAGIVLYENFRGEVHHTTGYYDCRPKTIGWYLHTLFGYIEANNLKVLAYVPYDCADERLAEVLKQLPDMHKISEQL